MPWKVLWRVVQDTIGCCSETEEGFCGENNVHSQEADKTAQCHGMSGFLSQHFTWQVTHSTQELSLISTQWIRACGAAPPECSAVTEAWGDGDRVLGLVCLLSCPFPGNELIRSAACGWLCPKIQTHVCVAQVGRVCGPAWQSSLDAGDKPSGRVCWTN